MHVSLNDELKNSCVKMPGKSELNRPILSPKKVDLIHGELTTKLSRTELNRSFNLVILFSFNNEDVTQNLDNVLNYTSHP